MRSPSRASAGRRRRHTSSLIRLAAPLAALASLLLPLAAPAAAYAVQPLGAAPAVDAIDVVGDDGADLYTGTGGLVVPARDWRGDESGRSEVASCEGCIWSITTACTRADFDLGSCPASRVGCPSDLVRVRVWLAQPGEARRFVGYACIGGTPPPTRTQIGAAVREQAEQALPPLVAGAQPADGALVGLPAVFRTGQPADGIVGADLGVLGLAVTLDARARWHWSWGDGGDDWTAQPGGRWPDASVAHTYRAAGVQRVTVTAVWRGSYVVEGLGPFPVPGAPLTQDDALAVTVREARAVLVG